MRLTFDSDTWPSIIQMTRYLFGTGGTICNFWALPDCSLIGQKQGNENNIVYVYTKEIKYQLLHPVYKVMASIREKKGSEKGAPLYPKAIWAIPIWRQRISKKCFPKNIKKIWVGIFKSQSHINQVSTTLVSNSLSVSEWVTDKGSQWSDSGPI